MYGVRRSATVALSSLSMAEAVSKETVSARLAEVREGLTLLADYL
jgi:hypothetical protein